MKASKKSSSKVNPTVRRACLSPLVLSLVGFIIFLSVLYGQDIPGSLFSYFDSPLQVLKDDPPFIILNPASTDSVKQKEEKSAIPFAAGRMEEGCNIFEGKWVLDKERKPMYEEDECRAYITPLRNCQNHGRPDREYEFWRWQPNHCHLPPFNATSMLEALRGKRMLFVGDSLNQGQFFSMVCLLQRVVSDDQNSMETLDSLTVLKLKEYNISIEFNWAPYLLESNSDDPVDHKKTSETAVRKESINTHGDVWKGADIIVFSTYFWWAGDSKTKILKGSSFSDENREIEEVSNVDAYRMGINSMLTWVDKNMDPNKTRVFFTSTSPIHEWSAKWGGKLSGSCKNETKMIEDPLHSWEPYANTSLMQVISEEFSKNKVPISFLNITQLSSYRKDAHVQTYHLDSRNPDRISKPEPYPDCVHWCLPGVPDTWNELLFAQLFYPS